MTYLAVMKWAVDGTIEKYMQFADQAGADAHVAAHSGDYPNAFAVVMPSGTLRDWRVNTPGQVDIDLTDALADAKSVKCAAVDALYSGQYATCTHLTFTWGADALSAGKIAAKFDVYKTLNGGGAPNTTMWADHGGVHRELSWADFASLRERIFVFHEDAFANMKAHKATINALNTVAAVEAYDISTGWPV